MRKEPTQKIEARKVNADLKTFGFSLAGGKDVDKNGYPGILFHSKLELSLNWRTPQVVNANA